MEDIKEGSDNEKELSKKKVKKTDDQKTKTITEIKPSGNPKQ